MAPTIHTRPKPWRVEELAKFLDESPKTVYGLIASGRLRAVKIGRSYRITDEAVTDLLAQDAA